MIQETSLEAYNSQERKKQRAIVFSAIVVYGECNDRMIKEKTGLTINCVTGRRNELVKAGLIKEIYKDYCPYTKRLTIFWGENK